MLSRLFRKDVLVNRRLTLEQLEERIVLDAAPANADNADNSDQNQDTVQEAAGFGAPEAQQVSDAPSAPGPSESPDPLGDVLNQDLNVVLISNAVDQVETLSDAAVDDARVIVYDAEQDDVGDIVDTLEGLVESTGQEIGQLAIVSHGASGVLSLGNGEFWTVETLQADSSEWAELGGLLSDDATIDLYGCNIGQGEEGLLFIQTLSSVTDSTIRASDDTTGNVEVADWDLEVATDRSEAAPLIDDSSLEPGTIRLADLTGTSGNDDLTIESTDTYGAVRGLSGDDTVTWNGGTVTGTIDGGADNDTLYLNVADGVTDITYNGTPSSGTLTYDGESITWANFETVYLTGNDGDNTINIESGSSGSKINQVDGGDGTDTININGAIDQDGTNLSLTADAITVNASVTSDNGDITLLADDFDINAVINAGSGTVLFDRVTSGDMEVGLAPHSSVPGAANFDTGEMALITAGDLIFGHPTAADNQISCLSVRTCPSNSDISDLVQFNALDDDSSYLLVSGDVTCPSVEFNANDGVTFIDDATITTTSGDAIFNVDADATGVVSGYDDLQVYDGYAVDINSDADLQIIAPRITEKGTGTFTLNANSGAGTITLQRSTDGTIGVGDDAGGGLRISDALLARMTAGTINFGNTNAAQSNTTTINVGNIDLSSIGATNFNTQTTGTTNFESDSSYNAVTVNAATVNLDGNLSATRGISGTATTINVLGDDAEIQDGIDMAAVGATVNVAAGSYSGFTIDVENLTVDGVGTTAIVNATSPAVTIAADGVTVQDLVLQGTVSTGEVGILLDGTTSPNLTGIQIINVDFSNLDDGIRSQGDIGIGASFDVTIRGNSSTDQSIFEDFLDSAIDVGDTDGDAVYVVRDIIVQDGDSDGEATGEDGVRFGSIGGATIQRIDISDATGDGIQFSTLTGATISVLDSTVALTAVSTRYGLNFAAVSNGSQVTVSGSSITAGADGIKFGAVTDSNILIGGATAAEGNTISGANTDDTDSAIDFNSSISGSTIAIANNASLRSNGNLQAIEISSDMSDNSEMLIVDNLYIGGAQRGIGFFGDVTDTTLVIAGNTIAGRDTSSTGSAIRIGDAVVGADAITDSIVTIGSASVTIDGTALTAGGNTLTGSFGVRITSSVDGDTDFSLIDNQIGTAALPISLDGLEFSGGILDNATVTLDGNTIYADGLAVDISGLQSSSTLSVESGTYDGAGGALLVDNTGVTGTDGSLTLGAATFVGGTGSTVVEVLTDTGNAGVDIDFAGAASISGGETGLRLSGDGIDVLGDTLGTISLSGQSEYYIVLADGAEFEPGQPTIIDVATSGVNFDGVTWAAATSAQQAVITDMIIDYTDTGDVGLLLEPSTTISLSGNDLVIEDFYGVDYQFVLTSDGTTLTIQDLSGTPIDTGGLGTGDGTDTVLIDFSDWSGEIIINALSGDDSLEIDYSAGTDFDNRAITFNGGTQNTSPDGDTLTLTGGTFTDATYSFANINDGSIELTGQGLITYTGLEPITSSITAANVTLTYSNAAETITITDAGSGKTTVDSTSGEVVTFDNPTNSLTINGAGGVDTINLESLDSSLAAAVTINGDGDANIITVSTGVDISGAGGTITINGGWNGDSVTVDAGSTIDNIDGGDGADTITNYGSIVGDIDGGAGSDSITNASDVGGNVDAGAGANSVINSGTITGYVLGGGYTDSITNSGSIGGDIESGDSNDTITNSGTVGGIIDGGSAWDTITNEGLVVGGIDGGAGVDTIINESGATVDTEILGNDVHDNIINNGTVNGNIDGGKGADTITNNGHVGDYIDGWTGNDSITNSGTVNYVIFGGDDEDLITNSGLVVVGITGEHGDDTITNTSGGYVGEDLRGGAGADSITNNGTVVNDIDGGAGNDTIINMAGGYVGNDIDGGVAADFIANFGYVDDDIDGGGGADTITNTAAGYIGEDLRGGDDADSITNGGTVAHNINGDDGDDSITNSGTVGEDFEGGLGNDWLTNTGSVGHDMDGGNGPDLMGNSGTVGNDILGGASNDYITNSGTVISGIYGEDGADTITNTDPAASAMFISGGNDNDVVSFYQGTVNNTYTVDVDGGDGTDVVTVIVNNGTVSGDAANGTLTHSGGEDLWQDFETLNVAGTSGADIITIDRGADVARVAAGDGNDVVTVFQGAVSGMIDGGDGYDILYITFWDSYTHLYGTPESGYATYSGPNSPDEWMNFESLWMTFNPSNVHEDVSLDTSGASQPFESTVGPITAIDNLLSQLHIEGLLPFSLIVGQSGGSGTPNIGHAEFRSLLFELVFGMSQDARKAALDDLLSFIEEAKIRDNSEQWLGLSDFMAQLHHWRVGKTFDDIVLAFNADECTLCSSLHAFMHSVGPEHEEAGEQISGLEGSSEQASQGITLVFNLDEMRVADMFLGESGDYWLPGAGKEMHQPDRGISTVFNIDELNLVDALAS